MDVPAEIFVGPSHLPSGVPADITPEAVRIEEGTSQEDIEKMMHLAAKDCKYKLEVCTLAPKTCVHVQ